MKKKQKVSADEAIGIAQSLHRNGRLEEAERIYAQILEHLPTHADALHYLGVLRHQQGRGEEAVDLIRRALAAAPDYADAYNNLGNVLKKTGRLQEAADAYRQVIELRPDHAEAWNNYGVILRHAQRPADAEEAFGHALALDPDSPSAHRNLADLLRRGGRPLEALEHYRVLLKGLPGNPVIEYLIQVCDPDQSPTRAPDDYLRAEFDAFAGEFDETLAGLTYRAPELLSALLDEALGPGDGGLDVLDAGCGTGLCGPLLRPRARRLIGVDLSAGMLEKARERGVYDKLAAAELTEYMGRRGGCFDLIFSADTLCYFGALEAVLAAAASALRPGGHLAFSVEQPEPADGPSPVQLKPTGRYGHGEPYLRETLEATGLAPLRFAAADLRTEGGKPVVGHLVLARKA